MKKICKRCVLIALSLVMALQLSACGKEGKTSSENDTKQGGTSSVGEPVRVKEDGMLFETRKVDNPDITMLIFWDPMEDINEINALYKKIYGGNVEVLVKAWGQKASLIASYAASGTKAEIVMLSKTDFPVMSASGVLEEIDLAKLDSNSEYWNINNMKNLTSINGKNYGLCFNNLNIVSTPLILFNKKIFSEFGQKTPLEYFRENAWNWDNFRKTAASLTMDKDGDGKTDLYGYDVSLSGAPSYLMESNGAEPLKYTDNTFSLNLNDPRVLAAYQLYSDMYNVDKSICTTEFKEYSNFLNGKTAMTTIAINQMAQLYADGMEAGSIGFAPFPSGPAAQGKHFANYEGHLIVGSVKGTGNTDATLAWMECAVSVWNKLALDSPPEITSYLYNDEEKAVIKEINAKTVKYEDSGLKYTADGSYGTRYINTCFLTAQEMVYKIRENLPLSTVMEQYKSTLQGYLDAANELLKTAK